MALGGSVGVWVGGVGGAATAGALGIETGPGELAVVPAGAVIGAAAGAILGAAAGGELGDKLGDSIASQMTGLKWSSNGDGRTGVSSNEGAANDDGDDTCEKSFESDNAMCEQISACRGAAKAAECYESAMQRYAACRAGKPVGEWPPLNTWNN
jgi:hypothetical protein